MLDKIIQSAERPKCGECFFFDTKAVDGSPIGTVKVDDTILTRGVCRAPKGLAISVGRTEASNCGQPVGVFKAKK